MKLPFWITIFTLLLNHAYASDCTVLFSKLQNTVDTKNWQKTDEIINQIDTTCSQQETRNAKVFYADVLAKTANDFLGNKQTQEAADLLNKAPIVTWAVSAVRGDLATQQKHWLEATQFYGQAYDLLSDSRTPTDQERRKNIAQLAEDAQLMYGKIDSTKNRDGLPQGIRLVDRGFGVQSSQLPVHFDTNSSTLNKDGLTAVDEMAAFLKSQTNLNKVKIIGFADQRGSAEHNQYLSEQRAQTVASYLQQNNINIAIEILGKGETEPPKTNLQGLTDAEKLERWRRVELQVKK